MALAPLSLSDREQLQMLVPKIRPAMIRIEQCQQPSCQEIRGVGTAFFIGSDGSALTAYHVIFQAPYLRATTSDGQRHQVKVIGYDDEHDIALIRIGQNKPPRALLPLASSNRSAIGMGVLSIGNGGGLFLQPKIGQLIKQGTSLEMNTVLLPGDSGAPVINRNGEVLGIVSFITLKQTGDIPNLTSYAVPINRGDKILENLRHGQKREVPVIGIHLNGPWSQLMALPAAAFSQTTRELKLDLGQTPGVFFTSVTPDSPAARAGLRPLQFGNNKATGDLITAVNGVRVHNFQEFQQQVRQYAPATTITLTVQRHKKTKLIRVTLIGRSDISY